MTPMQGYLLISINAILAVIAAIVAYYQMKGYNILAKQSANHTPAPLKVDSIEMRLPRSSINLNRDNIIKSGYIVSSAKYHADGMFTLGMTKILNGNSI